MLRNLRMRCCSRHTRGDLGNAVLQDDDEQQVVLLMDRLEANLRIEMRSWSQYDYEILTTVLTPVQVTC